MSLNSIPLKRNSNNFNKAPTTIGQNNVLQVNKMPKNPSNNNIKNYEINMNNPSTQYSQRSNANTNYEENNIINNVGESVKVFLRIRPMNTLELNRGDEYCIKAIDQKTCQISIK